MPRSAEAPTKLVVCNLGDHNDMFTDSTSQPGTHIRMLARVADLPEHAGVEEKPHDPNGRSANGSRSPTSQSGSSATSSPSQRSSIAATRCARSARGRTPALSAPALENALDRRGLT
jgi:hypothetical protein